LHAPCHKIFVFDARSVSAQREEEKIQNVEKKQNKKQSESERLRPYPEKEPKRMTKAGCRSDML
jgi:hypothetical protein